MIEVQGLLQCYLQRLRRVLEADGVSIVVHNSLEDEARLLLLHDGDAAPVPELADTRAVSAFLASVGAGGEQRGVSRSASLGMLVPLPDESGAGESEASDSRPGETPRRRRPDRAPPAPRPPGWLAIRRGGEADALRDVLETPSEELSWLLRLGGRLAAGVVKRSALLTDPLSGLPDRSAFQVMLDEELERSRRDERHLSLLFVNPDGFEEVNDRFGHEAGDRAIREMSARLKAALRRTEPVARFGGVIFAVLLGDTPLSGARVVAEKLHSRLAEEAYLDGELRLEFSIGVAARGPGSTEIEKPLHLIRRADQALSSAKRDGGNVVGIWAEGSGQEETGTFDRMIGVFTGNTRKDYRNMLLLWDTVNVIAGGGHFDDLAQQVVEKLFRRFRLARVALVGERRGDEWQLIIGLKRGASSEETQVLKREGLTEERLELVERALRERKALERRVDGGEGSSVLCYAVPMVVVNRTPLGCLYLEGSEDSMELDSSDVLLLKALGKQLAAALDRARLAGLESERQESERRRLQAEVEDLRSAIERAKLVYRSEEMESLVATARVVAPTDATILIAGESGTGKELLARTVHELSPRRERPMIVVDCGAITTSLIESELFGHEKGAFTGAQQSRIGRLAEADGGTILLDEIGELPLEVQTKLLRFVQEKQLTAVGGSRRRFVDVRILAATNRDLRAEVAAGRFREDLYHRLNVITLPIPPLRKRREDILHLARHFLERFSTQYRKGVRHLSPEAEELLEAYPWPGNVRELQNRLMQAVILCEDGVLLGPEQLALPDPRGAAREEPSGAPRESAEVAAASESRSSWEELRWALGLQLDDASNGAEWTPVPFGKWLAEDLVLEARVAGRGVGRAGASLLGLPPTTFQRRWNQACENRKSGLSPRPQSWDHVRRAIARLVREGGGGKGDVVAGAEGILLEEISKRVPREERTAAALLGVTVATYRRRLTQISKDVHA